MFVIGTDMMIQSAVFMSANTIHLTSTLGSVHALGRRIVYIQGSNVRRMCTLHTNRYERMGRKEEVRKDGENQNR